MIPLLNSTRKAYVEHRIRRIILVCIPAFCGSAIQLPPVPFFSMNSLSLVSSSGDQGPFFTFDLSQHGALPISLALSPSLLQMHLQTLGSLLYLCNKRKVQKAIERDCCQMGPSASSSRLMSHEIP